MSTNRAQRIREAIDNQTGLEGGYFKFLGDVTGKLTPMGKLALQAGGQDMIKATYAAVEQDPHSRNRYLTGLVSRLETKATKHESADDTLQEEETVPDTRSLRANHHRGVRCLNCGRLLSRIHTLPSIRTCPNGECGTRYQIIRMNRGLGVRQL